MHHDNPAACEPDLSSLLLAKVQSSSAQILPSHCETDSTSQPLQPDLDRWYGRQARQLYLIDTSVIVATCVVLRPRQTTR